MDVKVFPANWGGIAAKACDSCRNSAAHLFCRHHSAFLCTSCDSKIHNNNKLSSSHHERVIMCEVCEQAPAAVRCKADAAALCVTCDSDIHSANPLARRHDRVPIEPFYDSSDRVVNFLVPTNDEAEAASWILPVPSVVKQADRVVDAKIEEGVGDVFFSDFDQFLEFDVDSVVPVQQIGSHRDHLEIETRFEIDFCKSKLTPFGCDDSANAISHQSKLARSGYESASAVSHQSKHVSSSPSSLDVGIVPDGGAMNGGNNGGGGGADQLTGMDREARVLRYREKRKNRKFEKTIRYASRKAYAETRPRIKGRFAKRTETGLEIDPDQFLFNPVGSVDFMYDAGYGVVPSF